MKPDPNLIFDIGMHVGEDTDFYLKKGFHVVAVEANPALAEAGAQRFADAIASGRLTIENVCIGERSGRAEFYINNRHSEWSSTKETLGSRMYGSTRIEVEMVRFANLAEKYATPYYLKIDIEGADVLPILDLRSCRFKPAYVSYEAAGIEGLAHLFAMGYDSFKLVMQRGLTELPQPRPAREGAEIEHVFPSGSSGPFGEETPGQWSRLEDCLTDYCVFKHFRRLDTRCKQDWADFHARSARYLADFGKAPGGN